MNQVVKAMVARATIYFFAIYLSNSSYAGNMDSTDFLIFCQSISKESAFPFDQPWVFPTEEQWLLDFRPQNKIKGVRSKIYELEIKKVDPKTSKPLASPSLSLVEMDIFHANGSSTEMNLGDFIKFIAKPVPNHKGQFTSLPIDTGAFNNAFLMYGWSQEPLTVTHAISYVCQVQGTEQ